jgi:hypothetical protein
MTDAKITFHEAVESSTQEELLRQILVSMNEMKELLRLQMKQNSDAQAEWRKWREEISWSDDYGVRIKIKPPPSPRSTQKFF